MRSWFNVNTGGDDIRQRTRLWRRRHLQVKRDADARAH
jgi:hypothetical protein